MNPLMPAPRPAQASFLRFIPPPARWRPLVHLLPETLRTRVLERALTHTLAHAGIDSALAEVAGRRLGIEVSDLDLGWVFQWQDGRLRAVDGAPEASVRGTATDLLLLTSRLEDADTLFFQRKLVLTGDTELGLTVRNLLDRLPWETLPLALRIVLQRGAELARSARAAYHA